MKNTTINCFCCSAILVMISSAQAVNPSQTDDFQSPDPANWAGGHDLYSPPPAQISTGGPNGSNDGFLQISVDGFHLGTHNSDQWTGDYLNANATAIQLDANLISGDDVSLRILIFGDGGTWASTNLTQTLSNPGWQQLYFGLTQNDLTYVEGGSAILNDTLSTVNRLLIRNDRPLPTLPGNHPPHLTATLGLDNITLTTLPCPQRGSEGDFNCDAAIGLLDLDILGFNWNATGLDTSTSFQLGDTNADGYVGLIDLDTLGQNFNQPTSIPEPTTFTLLSITTFAMMHSICRKHY